jgi:hypothetical protein
MMMRPYLDQLTPDQIALIHVAFSIARDLDNCRICREAGYANCGDNDYESELEAAFEKLRAAEEKEATK